MKNDDSVVSRTAAMRTSPAGAFSESTSRLAQAMEAYLAVLETGAVPDRQQFLEEYADIGEQLRPCLDSLQYMHEVAPQLTDSGASAEIQPLATLGDFRLVREIGRGGMGIVYEAEQLSLQRRVALKVLPLAAMLDPKQLKRFRNEARAAAALKHPNIVSVYAVDSERGVHFFAMELVEGQSLAEVVYSLRADRGVLDARDSHSGPIGELTCRSSTDVGADTQPIAALSTEPSRNPKQYFRFVAELIIQAAEALHYAHQEGVVHRDIKPSNLMIDRTGKLWITDFGLARMQCDTDMTLTGDIVGTLRYMSPEQARGDGVFDQRSDVYSLGVTLYELLTLSPAFSESDRGALIHAVIETQPLPPRKVNSGIPTNLETIILKAISKTPDARYQTAQDLADDLKRFLEQKPIRAKRSSTVERIWRWSARNPLLAALAASTLLLMIVLSVGGPVVAVRQSHLARTLSAAIYDAEVNVAHAALLNGEFHRVDRILRQFIPDSGETDYRNFEWFYLWRECQRAMQDTRLQATWSLRSVEYSPDGRYLATTGTWGIIHVRDARTLEKIWTRGWNDRNSDSHSDNVNAVAFSPDGSLMATGARDRCLIIWRSTDGQSLLKRPFLSYVRTLAFSPDGTLLALGFGRDEGEADKKTSVLLYRVETNTDAMGLKVELADHMELTGLSHAVRALSFSQDGTHIAVGSDENLLRLWNVKTREPLPPITVPSSSVSDVDFSPVEPSILAVLSRSVTDDDATSLVTVWDISTRAQLTIFGDRGGRLTNLDYSPDGRRLVAGGLHGQISLWDTETWLWLDGKHAHTGPITDISFSPDGQFVASSSRDTTVRVWNTSNRQDAKRFLRGHDSSVLGLAVSDDSRVLISTGTDSMVRIWDVEHGTCLMEVPTIADEPMAVAISPDCRTAIIGGGKWRHDGRPVEVFLWDIVQRQRGHTLLTYKSSLAKDNTAVMSAAFSPDGKQVAATVGRSVKIWDVKSGRELRHLPHDTLTLRVAWSPIGDTIASVTNAPRPEVKLWNSRTGNHIANLPPVQSFYASVVFSPDGRSLAVAGGEANKISVCDVQSRQHLFDLTGHSERVYGLDYSRDGKRLASSGNGCVKIWNLDTWSEILSLPEPDEFSWSVKFAPDGLTLFASENLTSAGRCPIFTWRAASEEEVEEQLENERRSWIKLE